VLVAALPCALYTDELPLISLSLSVRPAVKHAVMPVVAIS